VRHPPPILVVDDTPENLDIVQMRLATQNYAITTAVDGEDALEKTQRLRPDLILLDIMMPKLVCRRDAAAQGRSVAARHPIILPRQWRTPRTSSPASRPAATTT
jgi:CheY-like chemotaxis protein